MTHPTAIKPESKLLLDQIDRAISKHCLICEDYDFDNMVEDFPELAEKEAALAEALKAYEGNYRNNELSKRYLNLSNELRDIKLGLLKFEVVHSEGGHEGGGEDVELVIHLTELDEYYASYAWYASYDGINDWGEWERVYPHKVVEIEYRSTPQSDVELLGEQIKIK